MPAALLAVSLTLSGCGEATDGPLRLPQGWHTMMAPVEGGAFQAFDVCGDGGIIEVVSIQADQVTGADSVSFKVAWFTKTKEIRSGGGTVPLPPGYEKPEGSSGIAGRCQDSSGPGMDVAVVFPPAIREPIIVKGVSIIYLSDGHRYRATGRVTLGVCPSKPRDRQSLPKDCR